MFRNGSVVIITNHFSLFTVVIEEPYPEIMKTIRRRTGGRLLLNEVPGVEVSVEEYFFTHSPSFITIAGKSLNDCLYHIFMTVYQVEFPHGSLDQDLDAYLRVLYNHEPMLHSEDESNEVHGALASPVIMLGPHGHAFSTSRKPVSKSTLIIVHVLNDQESAFTKVCLFLGSN